MNAADTFALVFLIGIFLIMLLGFIFRWFEEQYIMVVTIRLIVNDKLLQEIKRIEAHIIGHENSIRNLKKKIARLTKEMKP